MEGVCCRRILSIANFQEKPQKSGRERRVAYEWIACCPIILSPLVGRLGVCLGRGRGGRFPVLAVIRWGISISDYYRISVKHFAAVVGLPFAAVASLFIVLICDVSSKEKLKLKVWTLEFEGGSGQVILWAICFITMTLAINTVWDKASNQERFSPIGPELKATPGPSVSARERQSHSLPEKEKLPEAMMEGSVFALPSALCPP